MMSMDVTAEQEMWFFNAPYDWRRDVGNDSETNIKRDCRITIDRDRTEKVKRDQKETIERDFEQEIKGKRTEKAFKEYKLDVMGKQDINVLAKRTTNYLELSRTVKTNTTETCEAGNRQARVLSGNYRISVASTFSVTAG